MKNYACYLIWLLLMLGSFHANAQLHVAVENGIIYIKNTNFGPPDPKNFGSLTDSLDEKLKVHPDDTTSLFERALLLEQFNNQLAKATSYTKDPAENLTVAKGMAEHAVALKMKDLRLKILRAQIYKDLVYRYSVSESWKFTSKEVAERKEKYNGYRGVANKYYEELAILDSPNAYDYQKLKVR